MHYLRNLEIESRLLPICSGRNLEMESYVLPICSDRNQEMESYVLPICSDRNLEMESYVLPICSDRNLEMESRVLPAVHVLAEIYGWSHVLYLDGLVPASSRALRAILLWSPDSSTASAIIKLPRYIIFVPYKNLFLSHLPFKLSQKMHVVIRH